MGTITGGSGEYKLGGENTKAINIDLNGRKLNITTTYWSNLGAKNNDAVITFANGTMTSSQPTGTWNSYDLTFSNCNYVFENVTFEKAIALESSAVLKNVTINETHDYYAMWITAKGQTVTIDGLTINSNGRGIKIDEQYVDAPAKVTLNVSNATFNTVKKAAIMVKSAAGAEINLSKVDTANTPDPVHAVWVDEDSQASYDLVTVNNGKKLYEGDVVSSSAGLNEALANGETDIVLGAGNYTMPTTNGDVTISGTKDTIISGNDATAKNVTFNGVTIQSTGAAYTGIKHSNTVVYNDVTIVGNMYLYAENVVFNNCTFDLSSTNDYIWVYGATNVEFNNCTFNTMGKAILVFQDGSSVAQTVKVEGCTFNASAPAYNWNHTIHISAVSIDGNQGGTYNIILNNNTVDADFNGLWQDKTAAGNITVTVDGATVLNP